MEGCIKHKNYANNKPWNLGEVILILVVVELYRKYENHFGSQGIKTSFNPCCNGIVDKPKLLWKNGGRKASFNPCCNGIVDKLSKELCEEFIK